MSRKRKILILLAATIGLAILFLLLSYAASPAPPTKDGASQSQDRGFDVGIPTLQKVEAFVQGYGSRVEATEGELGRLRGELEETRKQLQDSMAELGKARAADTSLIKSVLQDAKNATETRGAPAMAARVRKFEFSVTPEQAKLPGRKTLHIPAGSFGEITLLTGIFAPVTGEALPIHARLDAALVGPNRTRIPIADAFLVGRAQGDPNGSRAIVQFHKLSAVTRTGESVDVAVNADVADADGCLGLAGRYVWRAEEMLSLAGLAGGMSGAAEALAAREVTNQTSPFGGGTSVVTGDLLKFTAFRGGGKGLEKVADVLGKRLEEITPAIYVQNGRKATVLFLEGATLDGFGLDEVKRETTGAHFSGLDFDR